MAEAKSGRVGEWESKSWVQEEATCAESGVQEEDKCAEKRKKGLSIAASDKHRYRATQAESTTTTDADSDTWTERT